AQFTVWQEGPHAKAFEMLGTPAAKEAAEKAGVGDPQKAGECLQCHTTAYGVDASMLATGFEPAKEGIGCETCHGPGSLYRKASVMNAKKYQEDPEGTLAQWKELGLIEPDGNLCITCHNEKNPFHKPFNFEEFSAKIAHPNPNIKK
ncbi:multiheme c-type cytochrome, partial [candidate division KSB1 bacterium]